MSYKYQKFIITKEFLEHLDGAEGVDMFIKSQNKENLPYMYKTIEYGDSEKEQFTVYFQDAPIKVVYCHAPRLDWIKSYKWVIENNPELKLELIKATNEHANYFVEDYMIGILKPAI